MLFKLLKSYRPANFIFILFLSSFLFLRFYFNQSTGLDDDKHCSILFSGMVGLFQGLNPIFNKLLANLLIFIEAFLMTFLYNQFKLLGNRSYLPMLIYLLIIINFSNDLLINDIVFANILFLFAWLSIKLAKENSFSLANYFNASLLIGIASLFYYNFIFLILVLWINVLFIQGGSFRELVLSALGVLLVWYFALAYLYLTDSVIHNPFQKLNMNLNFNNLTGNSLSEKITYIYISILFILSLFSLSKKFISSKIDIRNNVKLLLTILFLAIILFLFSERSKEIIHLFAIPVSLIIANYFINAKKIFWNRILLFGFILISIFNVYFAYLID